MSKDPRIMVIGANGQIGTELVAALRERYGSDKVLATDIKPANPRLEGTGPFEQLDVLDAQKLESLVRHYNVGVIYHLAALLSATAEQKPMAGWRLNMDGLHNVLNLARDLELEKVFWPSSIAAFGPHSPKDHTPQWTVMDPNSVYGISKLAGEGWCRYYFEKYGLDVRSVRYPGLISYKTPPGGGTTDYAVDIFHQALKEGQYTCFLAADTRLPMMYMPDAIRGTIELMEAPADRITVRTSYNFSALDFTPEELAAAIRQHIPSFRVDYAPDYRQQLAASWPDSIDDTPARHDWNWQHEYILEKMTADMLEHLAVARD